MGPSVFLGDSESFTDRLTRNTLSVILVAVKRFSTKGTADIFDGLVSKEARRTPPTELHRRARILLTVLTNATDLNELRVPPSNRLEKLSRDREGQYSIRVNDRYRICFNWTEQGPHEIEIVDYH